jgi:predicted Zn-dependent peptidase
MTQVRSISIGVWLTRGSRHESAERGGIAHFVEHMLFKGTGTRIAEDIAQAIDSIGGQLDAFTAKEYASITSKVLDEHLPLAIDILSDIVRNPAFSPDDIEREKKVVLEIKMVEDTPDDLVHELFHRDSGKTIRWAVRFSGRRKRSSRSTPSCCATTSRMFTRRKT